MEAVKLYDFLKDLCHCCEYTKLRKGYRGCPFRDLSNDHCSEYDELNNLIISRGK